MELWLYKNLSDDRYLTKNITQDGIPTAQKVQSNFYFKDATEIVNPVIILDDIPPNINYCWISELDRYYYVREITHDEGRVILNLHVDVLMTYRNIIKRQIVLADRSKNQWKQYIEDDVIKIENYRGEVIRNFSEQPFSMSTTTYILGILGSG